ncbi:MAG: class E sortase [Actinomycetota bacterium]|nr:class E sortase [Actinomycetota bacterium]
MAAGKRAMIYRLAGLALIAAGAYILLQIAYTDVYTAYKQRQLQDDWGKTATAVSEKQASSPAALSLSIEDSPTIERAATTLDEAEKSQETVGEVKKSRSIETVAEEKAAPPTTEARPKFKEKEPFARIVIPKIDLDAIVVEGVGTEALKLGPGHMEETAHPGEAGNMVISGHRVTYSRPFFYLDELGKGDLILVSDANEEYAYYVVETKVVKPTEISVIDPTEDRTLTLTTCNPRFSAKTRLIIVAKMRDDE